ncbi:hypothetical protein PLANPX_0841 [Lacipirellula parvula]|uniref:Uncharacterized protein n=1 Tax=Lacipirellula parvula TaxID=2650471 RepID=A0A5K7XDX9_9BACT|nr:hypothetical protein PLANPX_0841 [Lacipirellula parvula]
MHRARILILAASFRLPSRLRRDEWLAAALLAVGGQSGSPAANDVNALLRAQLAAALGKRKRRTASGRTSKLRQVGGIWPRHMARFTPP